MFGMSMTEIIIIVVVALLVMGPEELPKAAKTIGKTIKDLKNAGEDLRETFEREIMQDPIPPKPKAPPQGAVAKGDNAATTEGQAAAAAGAPQDGAQRPSLALAPPPADAPAPEAPKATGTDHRQA